MKIRNGFVSNSSSSSFVIVCKEDDHNKVMKILHPYYQKWISEILDPAKKKFDNKNVMVSNIVISTEDEQPMEWSGKFPKEAQDWEFGGDDEDNKIKKWVPGSEIMEIYITQLQKLDKDVITIREG